MRNKVIITSVITLFCSIALCSGISQCAKKVQLEVWDWYPARYDLWVAKAREYEKQFPTVAIKASLTDWNTYWNKVAASIAANTAPDIFAFHNSWTGKFIKLLEPYPEHLFPIRSMRNENILFDQAFTFGNKFYFYPQGLMTSLMFYNKSLWAETGLANTPKNWDDFRLAAKKLTRMVGTNKFDRVGFDISPWQAGLLWSDLRYQSGNWLYTEDGSRVEWDDQSGRKITSLLNDIVVRDRTTPIPGRDNALAFESGKVGISYQWTYMKSVYLKYPKLNYGTFLIPTSDGTNLPARGRNNFEVGFAVPKGKKSAERQAAFNFLSWLYKDDSFILTLNDTLGTIPAKKSYWSKPQIKGDIVEGNVALQAPFTVFPGEFPSWMYNEVLPEMCTRFIQSKNSPEQAVKWATVESNAKLKALPAKWVVERKYKPGEGL